MFLLRRPLTLAASVAVFLVLVGSALGFGALHAATLPVQRACANGAVKAIVEVNASQDRGFQKSYSSDPSYFKIRWACKSGASFQARRVDRGVYDVRVKGLAGATPVVTPVGGPMKIGMTPLSDGGIQLTLVGVDAGGHDYQVDQPFIVVFV